MHIYFSTQFSEGCWPKPADADALVVGLEGMLDVMDRWLAIPIFSQNVAYLRIEAYRQAIQQVLFEGEVHFFSESFVIDPIGTAEYLLSWRDELKGGGWNFEWSENLPPRLQSFVKIEAAIAQVPLIGQKIGQSPVDRIAKQIERLPLFRLPIKVIQLDRPLDQQPLFIQRWMDVIQKSQSHISWSECENPSLKGTTDLGLLQNGLMAEDGKKEKWSPKADGSLWIFKGQYQADIATFVGQLAAANLTWKPLCLLQEKDASLENALVKEGLPPMGVVTTSLARPTLQILKLAPAFLWFPVDVQKILEFVTLSFCPIPFDLAQAVARHLVETPGLAGEQWERAMGMLFGGLRSANASTTTMAAVEEAYDFWFKRKRYDGRFSAPKIEMIDIFTYLRKWSGDLYEKTGSRNHSLLSLKAQSGRVVELLELIPETEINALSLEKIVRAIYESTPTVVAEPALGAWQHSHHAGAWVGPIENALWWDFMQTERTPSFAHWTKVELDALAQMQVLIEHPSAENDRHLWYRKQPMLRTQRQLILCCPEQKNGNAVISHPLMADIEAMMQGKDLITIDIDDPSTWARLKDFELPGLPSKVSLNSNELDRPFVQLKRLADLPKRDYLSFTDMESLLYRPHVWLFQKPLRMYPSTIRQVADKRRLLGNLAHKVFEGLFVDGVPRHDFDLLNAWVDTTLHQLLNSEGNTLLMYGQEPERIRLLHQIQASCWTFVRFVEDNGWSVWQQEHSMKAEFAGQIIQGIADVILKRGDEYMVVDLKWSGKTYRTEMLRDNVDLQLLMYAHLLKSSLSLPQLPASGYYIISNGLMLTKYQGLFDQLAAIGKVPLSYGDTRADLIDKLASTLLWRKEQLADGLVELRVEKHISSLEEHYLETDEPMLNYLELPNKNSKFDEYLSLLEA